MENQISEPSNPGSSALYYSLTKNQNSQPCPPCYSIGENCIGCVLKENIDGDALPMYERMAKTYGHDLLKRFLGALFEVGGKEAVKKFVAADFGNSQLGQNSDVLIQFERMAVLLESFAGLLLQKDRFTPQHIAQSKKLISVLINKLTALLAVEEGTPVAEEGAPPVPVEEGAPVEEDADREISDGAYFNFDDFPPPVEEDADREISDGAFFNSDDFPQDPHQDGEKFFVDLFTSYDSFVDRNLDLFQLHHLSDEA